MEIHQDKHEWKVLDLQLRYSKNVAPLLALAPGMAAQALVMVHCYWEKVL